MTIPYEDAPSPAPLTRHQITRVLCAMLGGVAQQSPAEAERFAAHISQHGLPGLPMGEPQDIPSWRTAFIATIGGLYTWCEPQEIQEAVLWLRSNITRIVSDIRAVLAGGMPWPTPPGQA